MSHGSRDTLLVILIAGSLFFIGLGAPLLEPQESRYAEIPRDARIRRLDRSSSEWPALPR